MTTLTKFLDVRAAMARLTESKDAESHRWIVHVLAEMIEYSEAYGLEDVAGPLIVAIEKISPSLDGVTAPVVQMHLDGSTGEPLDPANIVVLEQWKASVADMKERAEMAGN